MLSGGRTLDDFAVPEEAQEMVTQHRPRIERLFGVELNILGVLGSVQSPSGDPQGARKIWLQLQGHREHLQRAKEYIKGLCAPELSDEVHYPKDMQCIFSGAHGLFLDCLIQGTSAHLTVLHPGALSISGSAEAFVMAQSRIQEFVGKHQKNPKLLEEREAQVKRTFRDLVENYDDRHAVDLLILPTAVKEELLNLVKEIQEETREERQVNGCWGPHSSGENSSLEWGPGTLYSGGNGSPKRPQNTFDTSLGLCRIQDQIRTRDSRVDQLLGFAEPQESPQKPQHPTQLHCSARPRNVTMNVPPAVGRTPDHPVPQASRTGFPKGLTEYEWHTRPQDFSPNLPDPQAWPETMSGLRPALPRSSPQPIPVAKNGHQVQLFPGCSGLAESWEDKREEGKDSFGVKESSPVSLPEESSEEESLSNVHLSSWTEKEFKMRLNFFKTMGYEERVVKKILLEGGVKEAPSTILDRVQMAEAGLSQKENLGLPQVEPGGRGLSPEEREDEDKYFRDLIKTAVANCGYSPSEISTEIQTGAPLADLLRRLHEKGEPQGESEGMMPSSAAKVEQGGPLGTQRAAILNQGESSQQRPEYETRRGGPFHEATRVSPVNPEVAFPQDASSGAISLCCAPNSEESCSTESSSLGLPYQGAISTVTGAQRFEEALQTKFQLKLANTPGKKNLRMVIIDGSNVAMRHGNNQFFSCRGIALAVQFFWDRGHRELTVLVPNHRMEEDSNVREMHYLVELLNLSILSLTPSWKIDGKGVVPYDDRMMLGLAETTDGIIVTNDLFRDLVKESKKWARIIKESLLQYIFVGNIFMVPDDPFGRKGPTLTEFLKKKPRTKASNCHSFSGRPMSTPIPVRPASQTEVLHFRDRRPPGGLSGDQRRGPQEATTEKEKLRPKAETEQLRRDLLEIFVDQEKKVDFVLMRDPSCQDLNKLSEAILNLPF